MKQRLILAGGVVVFALIAASALGGTTLSVNLQSCLMVLGGTLVSTLLAFPPQTFKDLLESLKTVYRRVPPDFRETIGEIAALAKIRRTMGPRELNDEGNKAGNPYLRKGVDLIADGYSRQEIHFIMEKEYELYFSHKESQINILNTMAKISPAFGFLGTVISLINILHNVSQASAIAKGMSMALLTTLYSLLFTNFLFLPMARKLSEFAKSEALLLNIILEGLLGIAESKNPSAISHRLESYLDTNPRLHRPAELIPEKSSAAKPRYFFGILPERTPDVPAEQ